MKGKREADGLRPAIAEINSRDRAAPAVAVDIKTLFAMRRWIAGVLFRCGVHVQDLDDVVSDLVSSAYIAAAVGRYRPDPAIDPDVSLKCWLRGLCRRKARKYLDVAWRRREIPHSNPSALVRDEGVQPLGRFYARAALGVLADLPMEQREILTAVVNHPSLVAYARTKAWKISTTCTRLRRARRAFARSLRRKLS
jgi:DNA-directed RNA polymerase specialized sigma24 family protein